MEAQSISWLGAGVDVATLAIASIVAIVSTKQVYTDRLRLRKELFIERFAVYKTAQRFLSYIQAHAKTPEDQIPELFNAYQRSRFLFGPDIAALFDEFIKDSGDLNVLRAERSELQPGEELAATVRKERLFLEKFASQLTVLHEPFQRYMHFKV